MKKQYFKYRYGENLDFNISEKEFVSIIGNNNDLIIHTLLYFHKKVNLFVGDKEFNKENLNVIRRRMSIVLNKHLNIFSGETVKDEIVYGLESLAYKKDDITSLIESKARLFKLNHLLDKDPYSLGSSDKVKMKILSSLIISPQIIVIDNVINQLDYDDKLLVFYILKEFTSNGGIVINFTNDIEETLHSDRIIVIHDKILACDGKTINVLNEEKLLKRLGLGLPFNVELNKYLMDYGIIDKYYLTNEKLVGAIWK
ncbi:MAG: hypothetical protein GX758_03085 [Tenericutes bacterium]|nr:hypothetical protein [Mycoplasmatota bacterium]